MPDTPDRPSIVILGFGGGIVHTADIALALVRVLLEELVGPGTVAACLPLRAQDIGDRWSITVASRDDAGCCSIEVRKRDAAILSPDIGNPEVLSTAAAAQKFAAILADGAGGAGEAHRQFPFTVSDHGDTWRVRGSGNADRKFEGPGPFYLEVRKRDARVLDLSFEGVLHIPTKVQNALREQPPQL